MKLLNPPVSKPRIGFCKGAVKSRLFEVRDKKFLYDGNSMDVFEVKDESEANKMNLSINTPQFPYMSSRNVMALVFEATHYCNIKCSYCFVDIFYEDTKTHMSLDTAIEAFNKLVDVNATRQAGKLQAGFFGGEPLVNWQLVEKLVPYVDGVVNPVKVNWGVTTNAMLMTPSIARFMIKHGFSSIISVDGPKDIHNRCRMNKNGEGSFDDVMKGIKVLNDEGYNRSTFRSTFLPAEIKLLERVKFMNDMCDDGKGQWVSVEPACLTESRCTAAMSEDMVFTVDEVKKLEPEYMECADWFIERVAAGKKPRFHNLFKPVERLLYHIHSPSECFTGDTKVSLLDGTSSPIADLLDKELWVYGYDVEREKIVPVKATAKETGLSDDMYEVVLDNGEQVKCTGDHLWLKRDGAYKAARDLQVNDSLMPLHIEITDRAPTVCSVCGKVCKGKVGLGSHMRKHQTEEVLCSVNHKVVSVRKLEGEFPTYCLEVESTHNFALAAGVFVHNCGAGSGYVSINPLGEIFACHREINSKIGTLSTGGIDESVRAKWVDNRSYLHTKCGECAMQWHCGGGCREGAIGYTGNIHIPDPVSCEFRVLFFKAALWILSHCDHKKLMEQVPNPADQRRREVKSGAQSPEMQGKARPMKKITPGCDCNDNRR